MKEPDLEAAKIETLTTREREVIDLVGEGLKNKAIAERLFITETIESGDARSTVCLVTADTASMSFIGVLLFGAHRFTAAEGRQWSRLRRV